MLRKQVEVAGRKLILGEAVAQEVEDCQDALASPDLDERAKAGAMRRLIAHCLNRGGQSVSADAIASEFSITENGFLFREAMAVSGFRELPAGEVLGP